MLDRREFTAALVGLLCSFRDRGADAEELIEGAAEVIDAIDESSTSSISLAFNCGACSGALTGRCSECFEVAEQDELQARRHRRKLKRAWNLESKEPKVES
jgi:hypothetical protein